MTSENTLERGAADARRFAYALEAAALSDLGQDDTARMVAGWLAEAPDPAAALVALAVAQTWHAASALVAATGGREAALELVRGSALAYETETNGEPQ